MRKSVIKERSPRVRASFPISIADGVIGRTTDISATGMCFDLDGKQELGSVISFSVELDTPGGKLTIVCEGKVVRLEEGGGKLKVATKIISQSIEA
jgi:hypothetical protein